MRGPRKVAILCLAVAVIPCASTATMFSAIATIDSYPDCEIVAVYEGLHSGQILEISPQDVGKKWALYGQIRKCTFLEPLLNECSKGMIVGQSTEVHFCPTHYESPCNQTGNGPQFKARTVTGFILGPNTDEDESDCVRIVCS